MALGGTVSGLARMAENPGRIGGSIADVNGFQVTIGLLLVSLAAPTALAEERVRGSLDVLMTTPMPTDRIVLAKWRGAYRVVPALALLPAIGSLVVATTVPDVFATSPMRMGQSPAPIGALDRVALVLLPTALMLAQGALVVSIGLALATWTRRVGRAVALSVTAYCVMAFVWIIFIEILGEMAQALGFLDRGDQATLQFFVQVMACACPLGSQMMNWQAMYWPASMSREAFYIAQIMLLLATVALALIVLGLTMATFNRCVGRASERPRRAPHPPRGWDPRRTPHIPAVAARAAP
jgi:uncharacterized protein (DUF2384 family)